MMVGMSLSPVDRRLRFSIGVCTKSSSRSGEPESRGGESGSRTGEYPGGDEGGREEPGARCEAAYELTWVGV